MKQIKNQFYDTDGKLINTEYYEAGEFEAMQAEQQAQEAYDLAYAVCLASRESAYLARWPNEYAQIEDIMRRGGAAVLADKQAIKDKFPKPVR